MIDKNAPCEVQSDSDSPKRPGNWLAKRRDLFMRELYDSFFNVSRSFREVYLIYLECRKGYSEPCADLLHPGIGSTLNEIWNRLTTLVGNEAEKGPLWMLKDLCHRVWPEKSESHELKGALVDWLIGLVFHEGMKLKENIYLLSSYGPAAFRMGERPDAGRRSVDRKVETGSNLPQLLNVQVLMKKTGADVVGQMELMAANLVQVNYLLRLMIADLGGNTLVVRLLAEREDVVDDLWGETLETIYGEMFFGGPAEGFCSAGRSYLGGQWYLQAQKMYQRALQVDARCHEAIVKAAQLQAVIEENGEILGIA